jgi:methylated-DNA-[protein]-cysteine S-methyltransferase
MTLKSLAAACIAQTTVATPLGEVLLARTEDGLAGAWFEGQKAHPDPIAAPRRDDDALLREAAVQLDDYFAGRRSRFDVPLDLRGTEFQLEVWRALLGIGIGRTASYAEIARRVGAPRAMRAVGAAVGRNPVSVIVPCHRVVGSDGSLPAMPAAWRASRRAAAEAPREARWRRTAEPGRGVGRPFLFMRMGAVEFGPVAVAALRHRRLAVARALARRARTNGRTAPPLAADLRRRCHQLGAAVPVLRLRAVDHGRPGVDLHDGACSRCRVAG